MTLRRISAAEFIRRLRETSQEQDKRFAFFVGAGCSVSSGIPDSGGLVRERWLPRLHRLRAPDEDFSTWISRTFSGYESAHAGRIYGPVMEELFLDGEARQREIEDICANCYPGFGYATLAALMSLASGSFSVVLTTNFDDLLADALYLYGHPRPLVITHESLADFIRVTRTRPMIVKLHGDHHLAPRNTSTETSRIDEQVAERVAGLLHERGLVFVGYGGNDTGIRALLESLPVTSLPLGVYWVGPEPFGVLRKWLEDRNAVWVDNADFDQLMVLAKVTFDLPTPDERIFERVLSRYRETYARVAGGIEGGDAQDPALKEATKEIDASVRDWWSVELAARRDRARDPGAAERRYREGLQTFPDSADLAGSFALFLMSQGRFDEAEHWYRRALEINPSHALSLNNYALMLTDEKRDPVLADALYQRALSVDNESPDFLGNYARFLAMQGRTDEAERYFERAVAAAPKHSRNLGNYAVFLKNQRGDFERAGELYRRALESDPKDGELWGNYALFLDTIRGDAGEANSAYETAIALKSDNANVLNNFAFFNQEVTKRVDVADALFKDALVLEPNDGDILSNYGGFLASTRGDIDGAERYFKRSIELAHGWRPFYNFAFFLIKQDRLAEAQAVLEQALAKFPGEIEVITAYATFLARDKGDLPEAQKLLSDRVAAQPGLALPYGTLLDLSGDARGAEVWYRRAAAAPDADPNALGNYAGLLLSEGRTGEGLALLDRAANDPRLRARPFWPAALEIRFYQVAHGRGEERHDGLKELKRLLTRGARSPGWNLQRNVDRARQENHPWARHLQTLADVISREGKLGDLDSWPDWAAI